MRERLRPSPGGPPGRTASLRRRIQVLLGCLVGVPLALLLFESYRAGRRTFLDQARVQSLQIARLQTAQADLTFEPARLVASGLARGLSSAESLGGNEIRTLLRETFRENPSLYGVAVALDPALTPLGRFAPYIHRGGGKAVATEIAYDYVGRDWFRLPVDGRAGRWIKPYFGEAGETLMISYSAPVTRGGRVVGVAVVDLDLDGLVQRLRQIRPGGGTVYLATVDGKILAHPDLEPSAGLIAAPRLGGLEALIRRAGDDMTEMSDPVSRRHSWIVETPIPSLSEASGGENWSLIVSWPLDVRLAPLGGLARRMIVLYLFLGGAALLVLNRSFDQIVTRPVRHLAERARGYARGDHAPSRAVVHEAAELQELSRALDEVGQALEKRPAAPPPPQAAI